MEHLAYFVKAAQREQDQDGFGLVVDLRGAQVLRPAFQDIRTLCWTETHLEEHTQEDT